jgi:hypothetical protein
MLAIPAFFFGFYDSKGLMSYPYLYIIRQKSGEKQLHGSPI